MVQLQRFHLRELIPQLDGRFRYVVEVRDRSWFQDLAYNFFADNNMCMVESQLVADAFVFLYSPLIANTYRT